ncbi:MAG: hypothetical protein PHF97_11265, partial [Bacteroidales bacterium]|nr:hypothetical protein [Bacteroidales bacterium]
IENGRWLVKTDYLGDTLWTRTFREIGSNYISEHSLIQATDGGFTFLGFRNRKTTLFQCRW